MKLYQVQALILLELRATGRVMMIHCQNFCRILNLLDPVGRYLHLYLYYNRCIRWYGSGGRKQDGNSHSASTPIVVGIVIVGGGSEVC